LGKSILFSTFDFEFNFFSHPTDAAKSIELKWGLCALKG
jgi:hypothetical protein